MMRKGTPACEEDTKVLSEDARTISCEALRMSLLHRRIVCLNRLRLAYSFRQLYLPQT